MEPSNGDAAAGDQHLWEFAGWGQSEQIRDLGDNDVEVHSMAGSAKHELGTWQATAICGNDITSSCLYVAALTGMAAGPLAPVVLLCVAGLLYLFRRIYSEVGSALPLNGGTYTLLLNSTNKKFAAAAACLTLLSYLATAVISAGEAMHYAHHLIGSLDVFWATVALLGLFAFLNVVGIAESANVAVVIFAFHMITLTVLCVASGITIARSPELLSANWRMPAPGGVLHAFYFGFAAAMLGISGFESSANFIEEQKKGVFPKTLRNMWVAVAVFNPLISVLSLGLIPLAQFGEHQSSLLATMGDVSAGNWLATWVSIDAVLVLSGAVLTSYVGVTGLVRRMTLDRCMPQVLLQKNSWRETNHWIIVGFFLMCVSILVLTSGNVGLLAGVYTISFLAVMALFAIGNMLLKVVRARLPRDVRASWVAVVVALFAVLVGLSGNLGLKNLKVFGVYFAAVSALVALMFLRLHLMRVALFVSRGVVDFVMNVNESLRSRVIARVQAINELTIVYFTRGDDMATLNRAALYVLENEQCQRLKVVHVYQDEASIPKQLAEHLHTIDRMYPKLRIDFVAVQGKFGPGLIERLSERLKVPKNYMFIGTPGDRFPHAISELGGVRLIL